MTTEQELWAALRDRGVPEHDWDGIVRHVMNGQATGDFLTAVMENNLTEACCRADSINRHALFEIVGVLYDYTPAGCWGSPEKVKAWRKKGGLNGQNKEGQ